MPALWRTCSEWVTRMPRRLSLLRRSAPLSTSSRSWTWRRTRASTLAAPLTTSPAALGSSPSRQNSSPSRQHSRSLFRSLGALTGSSDDTLERGLVCEHYSESGLLVRLPETLLTLSFIDVVPLVYATTLVCPTVWSSSDPVITRYCCASATRYQDHRRCSSGRAPRVDFDAVILTHLTRVVLVFGLDRDDLVEDRVALGIGAK
mmetsp:Transcript_29020/g.67282  ORF Transcript_29020/g.67282 Transcript_29020/m.67282 type:complete len:204 (-) Transcript_29020:62-673(-)